MKNEVSIDRPTFSVVIPLYQKRHRIEACLASIQAQTYPPMEVIVVDDGSTDDGGDVVQKIGAGWVRYVRQTNQGVSVARNVGTELATGSYVALIDADDTWRCNHLDTLASLAAKYPDAPIVGTSWAGDGCTTAIRDANAEEKVVDLEYFLYHSANGQPPFWSSAVGIRTASVIDSTVFPIGSRIAEDQDAWLTLLTLGVGFKSTVITADYYVDTQNPTIARARLEDFDSVIFTKWSRRECYPSKSYWAFVAAHRLYTLERHIGHTPNKLLLRHLLQTKSTRQLGRRIKILIRILHDQIGQLTRLRATDESSK